jgi:beta-lactamase superfamily II metal-dependent hydrolase
MTGQTSARTDLVILDVGHGNASILHEGKTTIMIDTALRSHVLEYLQQQNVDTIDLVILSHADQDHIGGLVGILAAGIQVKTIKLNADSGKETQTWRDLIFELDQRQREGELQFHVGLTAGALLVEGLQRYAIEVAMPTPALAALGVGARDRFNQTITSNSISACIRISFDKQPVALLAGDMDEVSLNEAVLTKTDLSAPLLVFPHHGGLPGSADPTVFTNTLLNAVNPKSIIFSIGRGKHQNPRTEILAAIRERKSDVRIACTQLSKACAKDVGDDHTHLGPIYSAGAASKSSCAGSIVIDPAPATIALPTLVRHAKFVANFPTAMCRGS